MPEESEEDESFEAGSDEGDSDDESVDAEDGIAGVNSCAIPCCTKLAQITKFHPAFDPDHSANVDLHSCAER